jgi:hypothetical protein
MKRKGIKNESADKFQLRCILRFILSSNLNETIIFNSYPN